MEVQCGENEHEWKLLDTDHLDDEGMWYNLRPFEHCTICYKMRVKTDSGYDYFDTIEDLIEYGHYYSCRPFDVDSDDDTQ